jgi:hypothetical protein
MISISYDKYETSGVPRWSRGGYCEFMYCGGWAGTPLRTTVLVHGAKALMFWHTQWTYTYFQRFFLPGFFPKKETWRVLTRIWGPRLGVCISSKKKKKKKWTDFLTGFYIQNPLL